MAEERHDPEFLKHIFDTTQVLRKPISGIIAGYHVLPYILVGPQEDRPARSVEIRGRIKVSPRLVLAPGRAGQTYGDLFKDAELMDQALVARVFSFLYSSRHQVTLESEDLKIQRTDRDPQVQVERALDELAQREVINTGRDPRSRRALLPCLPRPFHHGDSGPGIPALLKGSDRAREVDMPTIEVYLTRSVSERLHHLFESKSYRRIISSVAVDPDAFVARYRAGLLPAELVRP